MLMHALKLLAAVLLVIALLDIVQGSDRSDESQDSLEVWRRIRRQSRNNRVTDSYSSPSQELERTSPSHARVKDKRVYVENKYRPVFTNCHSTKLQEGQPPFTVVSEVKATDNDTGSAGEVVYTILRAGSEKEFEVDPVTGIIRSSKSFDRDEPAREKIAYVTVKASDKGTPSLEAICTFNVTIEDINDNAPMFDKSTYEESIPRDMEVNRTVLRIAATDIDFGENAHITYSLIANNPHEEDFFAVDRNTGVIQLKKNITQTEGYSFKLRASASDNGTVPQRSSVNVTIEVASSKVKPPSFVNNPVVVTLPENYTSYVKPIATFEAISNIENEPDLYFELVKGQTSQTNSDDTFTIAERGNFVDIKLAKPLDYETVNHYILTLRVKNDAKAKRGMAAETILEIYVTDVNDESPTFTAVDGGSVLENSAPSTFVLKVQAIDKDGTHPNNWVRYRLGDFQDKFAIDQITGDIRTLVQLDREQKKSYKLTVVAYDGNESSLTLDGKPNENSRSFQIEVADVNDNKPSFPKAEYFADIAENADINAKVSEVIAHDEDTDSQLTYDIISGNIDNVFYIESQTGVLKVASPLDYEKTKSYDLVVEVDDGKQKATTKVHVSIINVNDNKPQFQHDNPSMVTKIREEQVPKGVIFTVRAVDPDYDPTVAKGPSKITYTLDSSNSKYFQMNDLGELSIVQPLDRDKPAGRPDWSVYVVAQDELDGVKLDNTLEIIVVLDDINDNAPYLDMAQPVIWYENKPPGLITLLNAADNDEAENGPPFTMSMADTADDAVKTHFKIESQGPDAWGLHAMTKFDREERKEYQIPVVISDSGIPRQTATSTLTVVIGDENDNPMSDGSSSILVYNYKGLLPDTEIGRVYVEDKDDWDLPDKTFSWQPSSTSFVQDFQHPNFRMNRDGGYITLIKGTPAGKYELKFHVHDNRRNEDADATVTVTVKEIPEEAVLKSGSLRLTGTTQEAFVTAGETSPSKKDLLRTKLSSIVGAKEENVDVFTVFNQLSRNSTIDVRYSAHGSPYYDPVKLNGLASDYRADLESLLGVQVAQFGIDECLQEKGVCDGSCTNRLKISDEPYKVMTNTSSFVGVDARVVAECICLSDEYLLSSTCDAATCLNGGTCTGDSAKPCDCIHGYAGPRCEGLDVSFSGTGWAWYDPLPTCKAGLMTLSLITETANGLVLYAGPKSAPLDTSVTDFLALELREGSPVLYLDLGSGTMVVRLGDSSKSLVDGKTHDVEIRWNHNSVKMSIDQCPGAQAWCSASLPLTGAKAYLNVNGPLQVGGIASDLKRLRLAFNWKEIPNDIGFSGCIQNLTFNSVNYDLHNPAHYKNATPSCEGIRLPVTTGRFGVELIIILIVCFLVLLILILAIVAYRRRRSHDNLKEFHDDIRENIINYSDEGGGEGDMTGYDLSVLRMTPDGKPLIGRNDDYGQLLKDEDLRPRRAVPVGDVPDISQFLDDNKGRVDRDPDGLAYDDLRHYAYEGDGNSMGSLSSLASGTEDGDLDFDCLSEFGPRFKKLADMYGDHSSESDDDDQPGQSGNESWC